MSYLFVILYVGMQYLITNLTSRYAIITPQTSIIMKYTRLYMTPYLVWFTTSLINSINSL